MSSSKNNHSNTTGSTGSSTNPPGSSKHIDQCVRENLESYFRDLGGESPDGLYDMLVRLVERPLLEVVMQQADNNQSRAAEWLGLNRNTLRKKLLDHKLL